MNNKSIWEKIIENNKVAASIWFGMVAFALTAAINSNLINNMLIFKQSFFHLKNQTNLYTEYPTEYLDHYYYSPSFAALVMPFSFLPNWLATYAWGFFDAGMLYYAIRQLPILKKHQNFVLLFSANEMMGAASNLQSNGIMAATLILSFVYLIQQKEVKSTAMMAVGAFVKIYSIAGLAFFFFSSKKKQFLIYFILWFSVLVLIPLFITSPSFLLQTYKDWLEALAKKSNFDLTVPMYQNMVDITIQGMVKRVFNLPTLSKFYFIIPGLIIFALQYIHFNYFKHAVYRLYLLCSVLLFIIIFNPGTESPTYIIGVPAICLWYSLQTKTKWINFIFVVSIFFSSFSYSDLLTPWLRKEIMMPYALKVVGCFIVWIVIVIQILTKQFLAVKEERLLS